MPPTQESIGPKITSVDLVYDIEMMSALNYVESDVELNSTGAGALYKFTLGGDVEQCKNCPLICDVITAAAKVGQRNLWTAAKQMFVDKSHRLHPLTGSR